MTFAEGSKLEMIGANAFDSTALTAIAIPASVREIGESAFAGTASLTNVTFTDNADVSLTIGASAFSSTGITSITLPAQFTGFAANIFYAGESGTLLASISVSDKNAEYASHGGILYTKDYATLLFCPPEFTGENGTATVHNDTKTIAAEAFKYCSHLTAIDFGTAQVTSVGAEAFFSTGLTSIDLPDSVQTIGESAFVNSNSLTTFRVPESLLSFDASTLGLDALTTLTVSDGNDRYEVDENAALILTDGAEKTLVYYLRSGAPTTYAVPAGTTQIGENAFRGAAVSEVSIPASVTFVAANAFNGSALATVTFAQEDGAQLIIGQYAFYNTQLTEVALPARTFAIDDYAFAAVSQGFMYDGDVRLASITFGTNSKLNSLGSNVFQYSFLETIDLPASLATMGDGVFRNNAYLVSVRLPEGLTTMGNETFYADDALESVYLPSTLRTMGSGTFSGCEYLTDVTFAEGFTIERLAVDTFSGCDYLEEITLPASLTEVTGEVDENGSYTGLFEGLYYLTKVTFAEGSRCVEIGPGAFASSSLSEITLPASLTTIGHSAFRGTELESIVIPRTVTRIDAYAFYNTSLSEVQLGAGLTTLADSVFAYTYLESITLPASLTSLSPTAFEGCSYLTDVTLAPGNTSFALVEGVLFTADESQVVFIPPTLDTFTIPAAMDYDAILNAVDLLKNVSALAVIELEEENADFIAKDGVLYTKDWQILLVPMGKTSYTIPKEVTMLTVYDAMYDEDSPNNTEAFRGMIESITFEEGRTQGLTIQGSFGSGVFSSLESLTSISLPDNTTIGAYAFSGCSGLENVSFGGTNITIAATAFNNCAPVNSITVADSAAGDIVLEDGVLYDAGKTRVYLMEKVTSFNIPATLTDDSFLDLLAANPNLTSITSDNPDFKVVGGVIHNADMEPVFFPSFVTSYTIPKDVAIDGSYLSELQSLLSGTKVSAVAIEEGNTSAYFADFGALYTSNGTLAFIPANMETFTISKRATLIPAAGLFSGTAVRTVTYDKSEGDPSVKVTIGNGSYEGVFEDAEYVTTMELPGWAVIGDYAFYDADTLLTVTLGEGITSIGVSAFEDCEALTTINIPSTVTEIKNRAFCYCYDLASELDLTKVTTVDAMAFTHIYDATIRVSFAEGERPDSWSVNWNYACYADIIYAEAQEPTE